MRRKRPANNGGGDSWLNTYADMVTLLLTFFAVLLSMSSVNQEKFNAFIKSFSNLPKEEINEVIENAGMNEDPIEDPADPLPAEIEQAMTELYEKLSKYVAQNNMEDSVTISKKEDVVCVRFDSSMFFEPDKYVMRPESMDTMSFIGDGIMKYEPMIKMVAICGHTASVNVENYPVSEWLLSGDRAAVVAMYLENQKNLDTKKMITLGYGNNLPVADNSTEEGRKKNRRVELAIFGVGSDISFDPYKGLSNLYPISERNTSRPELKSDSIDETLDNSVEKMPADVKKSVSPYD